MHPTCTYLTNAGVHWLYKPDDENPKARKGQPRWDAMRRGAKFFNDCREAAKLALIGSACENPVMHKHARALCGPMDFSFQPWEHGEEAFKRVCWWLDRLPPLTPTTVLTPPKPGTPEHRRWSAVHMASPGPDRWKERSKSFRGPARAMAQQWGGLQRPLENVT